MTIDAVVVDASAAAAVVFAEPDAVAVLAVLLSASRCVVPPLFLTEVANVGRSKVRRGELSWDDATFALGRLDGWPLSEQNVAWRDAFSIARRTGLTVYDAVYLSLAEKRDLPLVTLDDALRAAAGKRSLV